MTIPSYKRIVTCAITGSIHTPTMSPYLPITPAQIAQNALDAAAAGASLVHIHARDPKDGRPSPDLKHFHEIIDTIRAKNKDVILCLTTGGGMGMTPEQRVAPVPEFKPELATLDVGSMNWGLFPLAEKITEWKYEWEKPMIEMTRGFVFENTFATMERMIKVMDQYGTKPEIECFGDEGLVMAKYMIDKGILKAPITMQWVMGIMGGAPADPHSIIYMAAQAERILGKGNYQWSVIGAGRAQWQVTAQALLLGGHVRVGMEDNLFLGKGELAKSNGDLVERMVKTMRQLDCEPTTPAEARELLGLKAR
jgi:uncharacterized protein (DUF849 family)